MKTDGFVRATYAACFVLSVCILWVGPTEAQVYQPTIEILEPADGARLIGVPVRCKARFRFPSSDYWFHVFLNDRDVTAKFALDTDEATATLGIEDGLRLPPPQGDLLFARNVLLVRGGPCNCCSYPFSRTTRLFFVAASDLPLTAVGTVTPAGGEVSLPGVASVVFPEGAFLTDQEVEISAVNDAETAAVFEETAAIFAAGAKTAYDIRIRTGANQTLKDFSVTLEIPEAFRLSVPADSEIRVFGQNYWEDESLGVVLDTFELFLPRFLPSDTAAAAMLPASLFTDQRQADGVFEAVVTLSTTPTRQLPVGSSVPSFSGGIQQARPAETEIGNPPDALILPPERQDSFLQSLLAAADDKSCKGATLVPPLSKVLVVSEFGPRDPSIGASDFHYAVDLRAREPMPVFAMHDGVVELVTVQKKKDGTPKGWGQYIVLRGDAGTTLYGHLTLGSPLHVKGQVVKAGEQIALSGNSGGKTGTVDPHLHIEYAPNGSIFKNDNKVDPVPCMEPTSTGSITVADNGSLADDAFEVFISGRSVCRTQIGASNTCAVGSLRPGTVTLTIVAVVAPDDVGTYQISLAQGLTFSDGTAVRSGTIPQGGSASFSVIVPATTPQ
jgi:murein DD-endopeptidase MepM/ murein hydrolase activator NlpD